MTGFEKRAERKRESIRSATYSLMQKKDVKYITIQDIAREAGVSPMSIYNYFESKDNLCMEVIDNVFEQIEMLQREIIGSSVSFKEKVQALLLAKMNNEMVSFWQFVQNASQSNYEIKKRLNQFYIQKFLPNLEMLLKQGKDQNIIDSDLNDFAIRHYVEAFRNLYIQKNNEIPELFKDNHYLTSLFNLFWTGLIGRS